MWRLIELPLAPVSTMAQEGRSSTSYFKHVPGFHQKLPIAKTFGSSVVFASELTGSFHNRILRDPDLELIVCVLKEDFVQND